MFSSRILMDSCLNSRSFIHLEFLFVYGVQIAIETQNGVEVLKLYTGSDDPDEEWSGYDGVQYVLPGDRVVYLFDMSNASMDQPLRMKVKGGGSIRRFHLGDLDTGLNYLSVEEMHEARIYELEKAVRQLKQKVGA